jgi:hypothetical protein
MSEEGAFNRALVSIDWGFDAPIPVLRCPVTGKVIMSGYNSADEDEPVLARWEDVPTVLFHYLPEVGEFDYIVPALQAKIDHKRAELGDEAEELSDFDVLEEYVKSLGEVPLVFCVTTSGMACGPISQTVYIGLDRAAAYKDMVTK